MYMSPYSYIIVCLYESDYTPSLALPDIECQCFLDVLFSFNLSLSLSDRKEFVRFCYLCSHSFAHLMIYSNIKRIFCRLHTSIYSLPCLYHVFIVRMNLKAKLTFNVLRFPFSTFPWTRVNYTRTHVSRLEKVISSSWKNEMMLPKSVWVPNSLVSTGSE